MPGVELHVVHIIPWNKGGKTVLENFQMLCLTCNLGKQLNNCANIGLHRNADKSSRPGVGVIG
jgi:5-methylcytosine-specific restriction endonuclease McrA